MFKRYDKRQGEVLEIIIRHYIETAEPVGSRFVAKMLGVSSATVRNVMADLEDSGLMTHPYTSAGRIPTDKGYRYYIDSLMRIRHVNENIIRMIEEQYHHAVRSLEDVLEKTSHLISSLTNYIGITLFPQFNKVYWDGTSHIIEEPEFRDIRKLHNILRSLEERTSVLNLLCGDLDEGLTIHIGRENRSNVFNECSIVTRGYRIKDRFVGKLGVIGPKRMVYEKVIPTVEFLADTVSDVLSRLED
jgi:transcriptional regulator of heat shock response